MSGTRHVKVVIFAAFAIGRFVYLRAARDSAAGMVTGYMVDADSVLYRVSWGDGSEGFRYEAELSDTPYQEAES